MKATSYAYNIKGDLTQMTYPSGRVVNFNYATGGGCCNSRLSSVSDGTTGQTIANTMNYDPAGSILNRTLNVNGAVPVVQTFTYNYREQQTQIRATEGSTDVMNLSYSYGTTNNTGEVLSRTDAIQPEHSVNYTYDSLYRLSSIGTSNNTWAISWTFDAWGNRLSQTPTGYVQTAGVVGTQTLGYDGSNHLNGQAYDAAGNVTNDGNHTYAYNGKNQITSMDGGTATYMYDGEGRRMKKTVSGVSTFYLYGAAGIISEFSTDTTITNAISASANDKTAFETADRQDAAVLLIASSGLILENNRTLPYGELWCPEPSSATNSKFQNYQRDIESNLDYANDRYLANSYGRMQSVDTGKWKLQQPSSLNRYVFTKDDPINKLDKTGSEAVDLCLIDLNGGCGGIPPIMDLCESDSFWGGGCVAVPPPESGTPPPTGSTWKCPAQYQTWIDAHGNDALTAGLPEANALALTSIESGWGNGRFAQQGNDFFNLETIAKDGTMPANKFAYQVGWLQARDPIKPGSQYYAFVATYNSPLDSFKSAAAQFSNLKATDPATFAKNAASDGINAGKDPAFMGRQETFAKCLNPQ